MTPKHLLAAAAASSLVAGAATGAQAAHSNPYAEPRQPIPYTQLNDRMGSMPRHHMPMRHRARAASSADVNASATVPEVNAATPSPPLNIPNPANPSAVGSLPTEPSNPPGSPLSTPSPVP